MRTEWRSAVLGSKTDECGECHRVGPHQLVRQIRWLTIGPIGILPIGLRYGLECGSCDAVTPLPRATVRRGLKDRALPMPDRPRPAVAADPRLDSSNIDTVTPGGGMDGSTVYLVGWVAVVLLAVGLVLQPKAPEPVSGPVCLREVGADAGKPLPANPTVFQLTKTPCALAHNFEVLVETTAAFDGDATQPPNGDVGPAAQATCEAAYQHVFGKASKDGAVELIVLGPDPVAWLKGGRKVDCAAYDPAHPWIEGTYQEGDAKPVVLGS